MSVRFFAAAFAASLLCAAAASATPPLDAYGNLPTLEDIALSPDGTKIALVRSDGTNRFVAILADGSKKPLAALDIGGQKLRDLQWADNDRLLITMSITTLPNGFVGPQSEYYITQWFDVAAKTFHNLFGPLPENTLNAIASDPLPRTINGDDVVFVTGLRYPHHYLQTSLFRVDLTTGVTRIVRDDGDDWVIDAAGNVVGQADFDGTAKHWKLTITRNGEPFVALDVPAEIDMPELEGLSEDGSAIVVKIPSGQNGSLYKQVSLKDGSVTPWQHADLNLDDLSTNVRSGRLEGGERVDDRNDYVFFDPHAQLMWNVINAVFKNATNVDLVSWSDDWSKVVVRVFGGPFGDSYILVDIAARKAEMIGPAYDGVTEIEPEKWIDYKASDGRVIHGYLTLPLHRDPKNLPLIVLPHGGPFARDEPGFDWLSQAIASRGYAVLQPEFRGSDGFGYDLLSAGFGEFGKKMQTDLSDGAAALAAQGIIDPKRICIVGASYGGYAALAGVTLQTGIYRCAVSIAGISDLRDMLKYDTGFGNGDDPGIRYWTRFLGVSGIKDPKLDAISPIKHVDEIAVPILLVHGQDDTVVAYSQSREMADALDEAKKPYAFVKLSEEDHWLSRGKTRLQALEAVVKFLETNNPPN